MRGSRGSRGGGYNTYGEPRCQTKVTGKPWERREPQ